MKKVWFTSVILSGAMAAGLYAQQSTTASSANSDHVTVQGCVERAGSTGATGTTGSTATTSSTATSGSTAGSSMAGGQFVLTNVSNSNTASTTAGTTGTTSSTATSGSTATNPSSSMSTASQYRLEDNGQNRLASYVGQKVEISGTVQNRDSYAGSSAAGSTGSTATSSSTGSTASSSQNASSNENGPRLKVDSIRMIASSCSGL